MLEIESMQEEGMTPMQIIVAATRNAAHVCNLGSETGTLEAGKKADILVVDGDPLTDIRALARTTPVSYTHLRAHETVTLISYAVVCL